MFNSVYYDIISDYFMYFCHVIFVFSICLLEVQGNQVTLRHYKHILYKQWHYFLNQLSIIGKSVGFEGRSLNCTKYKQLIVDMKMAD